MKITVTGRHVEVTEALKKYAEDKVSKFDKYLSKISEATVTLSIQKHLHTAEVLLRANGNIIQAVGITEELYASIDEAASKMEKQLRKLKDKLTSHHKSDGARAKMAEAEAQKRPDDTEAGTIIERRTYEMKPMPPDEAAMQLDMDGLEFLVFINSESDKMNVIYRRKDGNLGLIEPVAG